MDLVKDFPIVRNVGLSNSSYASSLFEDSFSAYDVQCIERCLCDIDAKRFVVFGSSRTGKKVRDLLQERFVAFIDSESCSDLSKLDYDSVIIATSFVHYDVVIKSLRAYVGAADKSIITLFDTDSVIPIDIIVESQPRSGTHYTIDNLVNCLNLGQASVFIERDLKPVHGQRVCIENGARRQSYLAKAHFYSPLHYPEYRYTKTIFLVRYVFDCYYSWAKMFHDEVGGGVKNSDFKLTASSREWQIVSAFIDLNKKWFEYIEDKFVIRYEDYLVNFEATRDKLSSFLGGADLSKFNPPKIMEERLYWSDKYEKCFDSEVFGILQKEFSPVLTKYWPEKH